VQVDILGPLRVTVGGAELASPMAKERALLEAMALRPGSAVPLAELESALWGEDPPRTAARTLQAHVAHLRHELGAGAIAREPAGYRLAIDPQDVDATRIETLVAAGESAWRDEDPAAARRWFREAEQLWRGEPLEDLADTPERWAEVDRLREVWQQAREGRIRADLRMGRHRQVLGELRRLVAQQPLREPLCALLMLALYRSDAPLEALRCYNRIRSTLAEQWDVDPAPALAHLQAQILRQDPQLDHRPPPPPFAVPAPASAFVGRAGQVEDVAATVQRSRLVTLHGPAGVGKSRLGQQVAGHLRSRYADGVWWVDLTPCADGDCVTRRVAEVLGIPASPGVPLNEWIGACLGPRAILVVLDNCEQVADPLAGILTTLLAAAPRLHVIATSRVRLRLPAEVVWEVPALAVPGADADEDSIRACDSVMLFEQRLGHDGDRDLVPIATLCRALDGIPLALELIAARAGPVPPEQLVTRLSAELQTAQQAAVWPPHHASVGRAIEWSYAQLPPRAQRLLETLSVAPADLDAAAVRSLGSAAELAPDQVDANLEVLVDCSLVRAQPTGEQMRYRLLYVIREFAAGRLRERGADQAAHRTFADHYRGLCGRAGPELEGARPGPWLRAVHQEMVNIRAAVDWSAQHDPGPTTLDFSRALGRVVWWASSDLAADSALLRRLVERAHDAPERERGWGWVSLVTAAYLSGDLASALTACDRAHELFEATDDLRGLAVLHWHWGAALLLAKGDLAGAEAHLRFGAELAQRVGAATAEGWCLAHLVQLAWLAGHPGGDEEQSQQRAESLADPDDAQLQAHLAMNRSGLHLLRAELPEAAEAAQRAEQFCRRVRVPVYEQASLLLLGLALLRMGQPEQARITSLRAARIALDAGNMMQMGLALLNLAGGIDREDAVRAARLYGAGTARAPVWPAFRSTQFPGSAARALGADFTAEVEAGRRLSAQAALDLAIG
jgi:predicted ATPase/DNA-binding SARP family transcriptional activator